VGCSGKGEGQTQAASFSALPPSRSSLRVFSVSFLTELRVESLAKCSNSPSPSTVIRAAWTPRSDSGTASY
jgi:hypothetical protein